MWRLGVAAASVLASLWPVASVGDTSSGHRPAPKCRLGHSHSIVADAQAQVYVGPESLSPYAPDGVFGCTYAYGRSYLLGALPHSDPSGAGGVEREKLAGPMVAFTESSSGPVQSGPLGNCGTRVYVQDLRDGRVLHDLLSGMQLQPHPPGYCEGVGPVTAIVLKSDGAVAWSTWDFLRTVATGSVHPQYFDLYAADKSGERLVASGTEIDPSSLALAGSTVYWTQGGKPMSTELD